MNKKGKSSGGGKCKNMMYVQQSQHLPAQNIQNLVTLIDKNLKPKKFAVITHDKDVDDKGNPKASHVHAMMSFDNARSIRNVAKILGEVDPDGTIHDERIEMWNGDSNNGFAYLVHATTNSRNQYQYDVKDVVANFDYPAFLSTISKKISKISEYNDSATVKALLDMLYTGAISKEEMEQALTGSQYAKNQPYIEKVWAKWLQKQAEEWRKEMIAQHKTVMFIWIYGCAGTGKTSFAKDIAKRKGEKCFISGSSRDIFQTYAGEHIIILDEFRPRLIPYHDLLKIADPFSIDAPVMAPARYADKALACELFMVTTPYSPGEYFKEELGSDYTQTDSFKQLRRRISLVIHMTDNEIIPSYYDDATHGYVTDASLIRPNPYSSASRPKSPTNPVEIFNDLVDLGVVNDNE